MNRIDSASSRFLRTANTHLCLCGPWWSRDSLNNLALAPRLLSRQRRILVPLHTGRVFAGSTVTVIRETFKRNRPRKHEEIITVMETETEEDIDVRLLAPPLTSSRFSLTRACANLKNLGAGGVRVRAALRRGVVALRGLPPPGGELPAPVRGGGLLWHGAALSHLVVHQQAHQVRSLHPRVCVCVCVVHACVCVSDRPVHVSERTMRG
jgi:hypothetical protein